MFMILEMNEDKAPPPAVGDVNTAAVCQLQFSEAASLAMFIDRTETHFDIYIYIKTVLALQNFANWTLC